MLAELDEAVELVQRHLESAGARNTEIETFLVRYLLILIYARYERFISDRLERRFQSSTDSALGRFASEALRNVLRGIKIADLSTLLGKLDPGLREEFGRRLEADPQAATAYNNILVNRRDFAHELSDVQLTLTELRQSYQDSRKIVEAFVDLLEKV